VELYPHNKAKTGLGMMHLAICAAPKAVSGDYGMAIKLAG